MYTDVIIAFSNAVWFSQAILSQTKEDNRIFIQVLCEWVIVAEIFVCICLIFFLLLLLTMCFWGRKMLQDNSGMIHLCCLIRIVYSTRDNSLILLYSMSKLNKVCEANNKRRHDSHHQSHGHHLILKQPQWFSSPVTGSSSDT